jgi:hypothetical protein
MVESKQQEIGATIFALFIACIPLVQMSSLADPSLLSRQVYLSALLALGFIGMISNKQYKLRNAPKLFLGLGYQQQNCAIHFGHMAYIYLAANQVYWP